MCFVMNKIAISILDTQDILTVLNTFSFQRPFPQLRKAQCFPITGCEERSEIKLVSISASSLTKHPPTRLHSLSPNLAFPCHQSMIGDSSTSTTTQPFRLTKISKRGTRLPR
ncbi:hypothetical protein BLNAU_24918 [Blattamonas nauphoetae]|uniref:Uncharacterized protein n=1 Tax=Blattamonas nauphoetae TaxID=2049346 RepID=A0ABQ9WL47_9EUKA|nr:hypothetical protein BLNAU_24918 [Blattamonas nauphoetae]